VSGRPDRLGATLYACNLVRASSRLARRSSSDLRAIDRATRRIEELTVILDRQLSTEDREEERLKHLRQATGQITRSANDGIQAYRRISQALRAEASHADADPVEVADATRALADARARMLAALEVASRRYPWAPDVGSQSPKMANDPAAETTGSSGDVSRD
jgi:septal ring factor EnvC (AmiA/AmiB activator)